MCADVVGQLPTEIKGISENIDRVAELFLFFKSQQPYQTGKKDEVGAPEVGVSERGFVERLSSCEVSRCEV